MDVTLHILSSSSKSISQLSSMDFLDSEDDLLVSKFDKKSGKYIQCKISYGELSSRLSRDVLKRLNLGSMAFKNSSEYSLRNHVHDYSNFRFSPVYTWSDVKDFYPSGTDRHGVDEYLGTIRTWTNTGDGSSYYDTDMYAPYIEFNGYSELSVGEIRFISIDEIGSTEECNPISIRYENSDLFYDSENDGYWVYPDGRTIECNANDFQNACKKWGDNQRDGKDLSFTIPLLSGFVRPNPGLNRTESISHVHFENSLPNHTHVISNTSLQSGQNILCSVFQFPTLEGSPTQTGSWRLHGGSGKNTSNTAKLTRINVYANINSISSSSAIADNSGNDIEPRPYSYRIPCLIYIGRK